MLSNVRLLAVSVTDTCPTTHMVEIKLDCRYVDLSTTICKLKKTFMYPHVLSFHSLLHLIYSTRIQSVIQCVDGNCSHSVV